MLKLDFKVGARLLIRNDIWIECLAIRGKLVSVGITGPPDVEVNREKIAIAKGLITAAQASGVPRMNPEPVSRTPKAGKLESEKAGTAPGFSNPVLDPAMEETLRIVRAASETNGRYPRHD